ncbi:primosomal protein N' [uncultured Mailhella sp.]|uniref:replication restart helicase PriA n=1 Tax=uncultured Mailhella sp. TaxID=1981031 RepID=UPI00262DAC73|nr:primosomal protein N' [uncultured Mailhella sp.]
MLCRVALCSPPYATLTYSAPSSFGDALWTPGLRVAVPLGNGAIRAGVITAVFPDDDSRALAGAAEDIVLRPLTWPLELTPLLSRDYMETVLQLAARQYASPGQILGNLLPKGLRVTANIRVRQYLSEQDGKGRKPRLFALRDIPSMPEEEREALAADFLAGRAEVLMLAEDAAEREHCELCCDPPWPVRPNAAKQRELLDWLLQHGSVSRRRLREALPGSAATLSSLVRAKLVKLCPESSGTDEAESDEELLPPPETPFRLSPEQQAALDGFLDALDRLEHGEHVPFARLLFGVTGSGKTAVYLELAHACFLRGRSTLLLAPEVAIALKLRRDAKQRFPNLPVFFYHGYQNQPLRERTFRSLARRREPCLIVGTRSAVFLPLPHLGAIVLDEEHDSSFKQEDHFPYQAKEVAWERARRHRALLVLGSATPDIKTFYTAQQGVFPLARLPHRAGGGSLPEIEFVDIKNSPAAQLLSERALAVLRETVERGEQAVIMLNRRGYSPLLYCLDCGTVARCPNCDIALTYHKRREQMVCHYCGYTRPFPSPCLRCGGVHFLPMGDGTEKLEETLASQELAGVLPPGGRVLRLDRDSTSRTGRMEEILSAFAHQEAQVLVGTQMLSKGHHFPQVTLVIVADGDMGLNLPDYRSAERTFQLLVQSSGRAGRGEKPGRVLIQTRDIGHYCWNFVKNADYEGFYAHELELRQKRLYPPFVKLALTRLSFPFDRKDDQSRVQAFAAALRRHGRTAGLTVLGPAPAPLARLQGRLRFQCLIKAQDWQSIRQTYSLALRDISPLPRDLRISLDLDPVNML